MRAFTQTFTGHWARLVYTALTERCIVLCCIALYCVYALQLNEQGNVIVRPSGPKRKFSARGTAPLNEPPGELRAIVLFCRGEIYHCNRTAQKPQSLFSVCLWIHQALFHRYFTVIPNTINCNCTGLSLPSYLLFHYYLIHIYIL